MNFHGKDIKIFTANSNPMVAKRIAECLGLPLGKSEVGTFSDGEIAVSLFESVRGSDCFIVQSTCSPVNNNIMELLIMIDAMKRASAARITAVIPYFGYARQDRKAKARDPISAKLVADLITTARRGPGADYGSPRASDPGVLQYPGRPSGGRAYPGVLSERTYRQG